MQTKTIFFAFTLIKPAQKEKISQINQLIFNQWRIAFLLQYAVLNMLGDLESNYTWAFNYKCTSKNNTLKVYRRKKIILNNWLFSQVTILKSICTYIRNIFTLISCMADRLVKRYKNRSFFLFKNPFEQFYPKRKSQMWI